MEAVSTRFVPSEVMTGLSSYPDSWLDLPEEKKKPGPKPKQRKTTPKRVKLKVTTPVPPVVVFDDLEDLD